jgi:hypothetical protein
MKTIILMLALGAFAACNSGGNSTNSSDSTATKDNTSVYDTGTGSSMTDTAQHKDTAGLTNKMQDTGMKK